MLTKVCTKCGKEKEATAENFQKHAQGLYGLRPDCKECCNARKKEYLKAHPGYRVDYQKQYRENNKERLRVLKKQYLIDNQAKSREYFKQLRETDAYKEKRKEYVKIYHQENRECLLQKHKKWAKQNRTKVNMNKQRRKAKAKLLPSSLTESQWTEIKGAFNNKCAYCGSDGNLAQEHFIPLSKGGEYTANNIIPSCQSCNSSKRDKDFFEWYPSHVKYSKRREQKILKHLGYDETKNQQLALTL